MASKYMQRKFDAYFADGAEFWTGEDGDLVALVIKPRPDWAEVLQREYSYRLKDHAFDVSRAKERFAYRHSPNREWPDSWPGQRKIWTCGDEPTEFPVIYYSMVD